MILQFPTPYRDELLYSTLARYHLRSGNVFWKHTLEDLFGKRTISATAFLPSGIRSLIKHLPMNTTINEQSLIYNHTMFPFYTAFLPKEKAVSIYEAMLSDDGKKIYMQSGIMASSIPQNKYFKYCPECFKEDNYGEMFWQRQHQLPGKLICTKHALYLEDSSVPMIQSNKHSFILPDKNNCDLTEKRPVDKDILEFYLNFHSQAEKLLNKRFEHKTFAHFTEFYRKNLINRGFANINGQVNQKELHKAFRTFYPKRFLDSLNIDTDSIELWLASITRKHRKSFHPYYHILLLNFLGLDIDDVFEETSISIEPFGRRNWPCLNIVCPDYKKDVIQNVSIRTCEKTKQPIGRFTCPICGFSYTRKGKEQKLHDRYKYTRIMEFGSLWKKELRLLLGESLSYREIARRLQVDTNTVIKYEKILKGECESIQKPITQRENQEMEIRRQEWLLLIQENPNLSKTELRKVKPSTYIYLYRHDKYWLDENSPKPRKSKVVNKRVNWQKRDQEILQKVKKATEELQNIKGKLKRITVKAIADGIGERALLEQHLDKMPKTKLYIEKVCESYQQFRLRRVTKVIDEMNESGEVIKMWKVLRRANIKPQFKKEVIEFIQLNINK